MEDNNAQNSRPGKVSTAVTLMYVSLAIGLLQFAIGFPHWREEHPYIPVPVMLFTPLAVYCFLWFLIYKTGRGRNWARITNLVLFILGVPISLAAVLQSSGAAQMSELIGVAAGILNAIALVFLFQAPSSEWFRQMTPRQNLG